MPFPEPGTAAPDFSASDADGIEVSLASLKGTWAVIYFYPKDDTPGCTKEACGFRDNFAAIGAAGAKVVGVSGDSAASHRRFAEKYELPFTLLVDAGNEVARKFGAWGTKQNYGRTYEGIIRSTVIIDPQGNVAKVWKAVKADGHAGQVLDWLRVNAG